MEMPAVRVKFILNDGRCFFLMNALLMGYVKFLEYECNVKGAGARGDF